MSLGGINGFHSSTNLPGSTALPFVISTGAQRSGEISVWMLFLGGCFRALIQSNHADHKASWFDMPDGRRRGGTNRDS
jgi:hypothetical protein